MKHKFVSKHISSNIKESEKGKFIATLSSDDFLFSQSTIVSSVALESNKFYVTPETACKVNVNGDCWSNESLKANYKSFIGAWNFINHVQDPDKSVGFIADVGLRKIYLAREKKAYVYYADILIATHKDHQHVCSALMKDDLQFMSMGCEALITKCSKCGQVFTEEEDLCDHLALHKGKYFFDSQGTRRIIAELLGNEEPNSCIFIEASYLSVPPAFGGAVKRHILAVPSGIAIQIAIPENAISRDAIRKYVEIK